MNNIDIYKDDFLLTTDKSKMDLQAIHHFLANHSYWVPNIPFEIVKKSFENSLTFGIIHDKKQIAYARVISDYATIAYLGDVYVLDEYRGKGLSKWLMETIINHPELNNLRRWILLTLDAHKLYEKYGWKSIAVPERWMEKHNPNFY